MAKRILPIFPTLSEVLCQPPNADGSRKLCANCCLFIPDNAGCFVHGRGKFIFPHQVCGYHVFGEPLAKHPKHGEAIPGTSPELSGLINTFGTSCDRCSWYVPTGPDAGLCQGVHEHDQPAAVEALGCCARWRND